MVKRFVQLLGKLLARFEQALIQGGLSKKCRRLFCLQPRGRAVRLKLFCDQQQSRYGKHLKCYFTLLHNFG